MLDDLPGHRRGTTSAAATPRAVPAVTRAIAILRLLGTGDAPMGVNMIAARLGIVPSTCLHILRVLVAEELVRVDRDTKRYSLDAGVLTLARSVLRPSSFGSRIQSRLEEFVTQFPVTALAARIVNLDHMVVIASAASGLAMRIHVEIGARQPALMSATGRCVAAFGSFPPARIAERFARLRWDNPPSFEDWLAEVEQTRRLGYSIDRGNYMRGVTVIAAPVLGPEGVLTHALVAVGFSEQIESVGTEGISTALRDIGSRANG